MFDYSPAKLPFVNQADRVLKHNHFVKSLFWQSWHDCFEQHALPKLPEPIAKLWRHSREIFQLAFIAHRYGMIFFASRREVSARLATITTKSQQIDEVYQVLSQRQLLNTIYNLTINHFVFSWPSKAACAQMIAPNQFQLSKEQVLYYRDDAFYRHSEQVKRLGDEVVYDLHDFAHLVSTLCKPTLYGCYYHDLSAKITNKQFRNMISLPGKRDLDSQIVADGFVYTCLTRHLYDTLVTEPFTTPDDLVEAIAEQLSHYYLAEQTLTSAQDGKTYRLNAPIETGQLVILALNKLYEHSASEVEHSVFIRAEQDSGVLELSPSNRLQALAAPLKWLYPEARNTIRHRAHALSYIKTAKALIPMRPAEASILDQVVQLLGADPAALRTILELLSLNSTLNKEELL
ncbi:hypothetical protein [Pseudoalteromonas rubra]|uniref:Uncharacterized protein n=1 Tax=Pseudoalteromonas rubra TaxID=43658 RepID=A0A0U3IJA5_9GAMM|nr:hypothetical protein [Pseudoalteromonas rubra]ALU43388.1 hypothetical protein AT705_10795 [Pseudoalteromonas rubra]